MQNSNQPSQEEIVAQDASTETYERLGTRFGVASVPAHLHNGTDSPQIPFGNIAQKQVFVSHVVPDTQAIDSSDYGTFWIAPAPCTVVSAMEVHQAVATDGGTVTLQVQRLQGTEAAGAGDNLLITPFNLKGTANTVQYGSLVLTRDAGIGYTNLAKGERLCLTTTGVLTGLRTVTVVVTVQF